MEFCAWNFQPFPHSAAGRIEGAFFAPARPFYQITDDARAIRTFSLDSADCLSAGALELAGVFRVSLVGGRLAFITTLIHKYGGACAKTLTFLAFISILR